MPNLLKTSGIQETVLLLETTKGRELTVCMTTVCLAGGKLTKGRWTVLTVCIRGGTVLTKGQGTNRLYDHSLSGRGKVNEGPGDCTNRLY